MNKPSRKEFIETVAFAGLTLAGCATGSGKQSRKRPNFLFVFTDDQTYRAIGYNNPVVKTPHLDELARQGVIFDNTYIASPICVASRASLLTGMFPQQHGVISLDNASFVRNIVEGKRYPCFPELLRAAGYRTAYCGKAHVGNPRDFGFDEGQEHTDTLDNESMAFAKQFLRTCTDERPFLLWVAARQPHVPLLPAQEWLDLYKDAAIEPDPNFMEAPTADSIYNQGAPGQQYYRDSGYTKNYKDLPAGPPRTREQIIEFMRAYYATISRLDGEVGELVASLKASGKYDDTIIVFLADNGYHLGNHGLGNKITMHEESVHVPMFMHGPMLPKKGVRCDALVSSLDIFPTLLELAGVERPKHLSGRSLRPLLSHPHSEVRNCVFSECTGVGGKIGDGHRMARTHRWKYILTDANEEALFDEQADPFEMNNVAVVDANKQVLSELRRAMSEWMDSIGDTHARPS